MKIEDLNPHDFYIEPQKLSSLVDLLEKLNKIEAAYGKALICTSGIRTWNDHKRIYREINDRRIIAKLPELVTPLHSAHLDGKAADIADPHRELQNWVCDHLDLITDLDLYMEDFESTKTWVHFQTKCPSSQLQVPPLQRKRWFKP